MEEIPYPNTAEGYKLEELIGKGMFNNEVYRATIPAHNNEQVAIKIIDLEEYSQENLESIRVRENHICILFWRLLRFAVKNSNAKVCFTPCKLGCCHVTEILIGCGCRKRC